MLDCITKIPKSLPARSTLLVVALLGSPGLLLSACGGNDEKPDIANTAEAAYLEGKKAMNNSNYRRAISIFEAIQSRFPFSEIGKQSELDLMYAHYKSGHQEAAVDAADQFMRENPTHPRIDYALYIKALAYFDDDTGILEGLFRKDVSGRPPVEARRAFSLFKRLVEQYPASDYAADSEQRMIYLKNRLAAYQNKVAEYYMKRGAYVAALNRAQNALEEFNGTPSTKDTLKIIIKAYTQLGMTDLADDTRQVLAQNFPGEG